MNELKKNFIIGIISFIIGCIFTFTGIYTSQSFRNKYNQSQISTIENSNTQLRNTNKQLEKDIIQLREDVIREREQLEIERQNNRELASTIQSIENGNITAGAIINDIENILNQY